MAQKRKLKLVNAASYTGPRVKGAYLKNGDVYTFDNDEEADACLEITSYDRRGNEIPIFREVTGEVADKATSKPAKATKAETPTRRRREARPAAAEEAAA